MERDGLFPGSCGRPTAASQISRDRCRRFRSGRVRWPIVSDRGIGSLATRLLPACSRLAARNRQLALTVVGAVAACSRLTVRGWSRQRAARQLPVQWWHINTYFKPYVYVRLWRAPGTLSTSSNEANSTARWEVGWRRWSRGRPEDPGRRNSQRGLERTRNILD